MPARMYVVNDDGSEGKRDRKGQDHVEKVTVQSCCEYYIGDVTRWNGTG